MRVIVTRPGPQAGKWVNALRNAGLDALSLPLIEIVGPPDEQAVTSAWKRLSHFDAVMLVSANAVEQFFAHAPQDAAQAQLQAALQPRFFVTGPGSLEALLKVGVERGRIDVPNHASAQFDSEALWQAVGHQVRPGWRVLIVRGNRDADAGDDATASTGVGRDWFAARLHERGSAVEFLVAYVRRAPVMAANTVALMQVAASDGSVWLFSSSEAVSNLSVLMAGQSWSQARAVATHPRIAQSLLTAGFGVVLAARPAMADLLASIESLA